MMSISRLKYLKKLKNKENKMSNPIKIIKRVNDKFNKNGLVFRDEEGRIAYLDKYEDTDLVNEMVPAVGGMIKCYVVKSLASYDFVRVTINGTGLPMIINDTPNLTDKKLDELGREYVWFLNTIYNSELKGTTAFKILKDSPCRMLLNCHNGFPKSWDGVIINELSFTNYLNIISYIYNIYKYDARYDTDPAPKMSDTSLFNPNATISNINQAYAPLYNQYTPSYQQNYNDPYSGFNPNFHNTSNPIQPRSRNILLSNLSNKSMLDRYDTIINTLQLDTNYICSINGQPAQIAVKKVYADKDPVIIIIYNPGYKIANMVGIITKEYRLNELYKLDTNHPLTAVS